VLRVGRRQLNASAGDFQEAKNVDSVGEDLLPNTAFASGSLRVVNGPTVAWLDPEVRACMPRRAQLTVIADASTSLRSVRFLDGSRGIATVKRRGGGLFGAVWQNGQARKGRHLLRAIVIDAQGRKAEAQRVVRICR
jgi:hypothetical protein